MFRWVSVAAFAAAVVLGGAAALAGCGGSSAHSDDTLTPVTEAGGHLPGAPTSAGSTTTTGHSGQPGSTPGSPSTTIDVTKVPATITVPYVQAVLDANNKVAADAMNEIRQAGKLTPETEAKLGSVLSGPFLRSAIVPLREDASRVLSQMNDPARPRLMTVRRIARADKACIVADADVDSGPLLRAGGTHPGSTITLQARARAERPDPTAWTISFFKRAADTGLPDPCA